MRDHRALAILTFCAPFLLAQAAPPQGSTRAQTEGTITLPEFTLPFSEYASPEALRDFALRREEQAAEARARASGRPAAPRSSENEPWVDRALEAQKRKYPATMSEAKIGGVGVRIFTPVAGISTANKGRVLINLHGGGFTGNWDAGSWIESLPLASAGRIKVISVNYRMAPQFRFPAASEDVANVYRELLKTHKPSQIAIYGCSAGGVLGPQAIALLQKMNLPAPAALGIFSGSLTRITGDSLHMAGPLAGFAPPVVDPDAILTAATGGYFKGARNEDPLMWPAASKDVLRRFPPTLLTTGVRGVEMSATVQSHLELVNAGVDARLFLWEGVGHCFMYNPDLPESERLYDIAATFFRSAMDR